MGKPAQALTAAVVNYLTAMGAMCWKNGVGSFRIHDPKQPEGYRFAKMGTTGMPDVMAIWRPRNLPKDGRVFFLAIEIKANTDTLRPEQKQFLENVQQHGGVSLVIRDLSEVIAVCNKIQQLVK